MWDPKSNGYHRYKARKLWKEVAAESFFELLFYFTYCYCRYNNFNLNCSAINNLYTVLLIYCCGITPASLLKNILKVSRTSYAPLVDRLFTRDVKLCLLCKIGLIDTSFVYDNVM